MRFGANTFAATLLAMATAGAVLGGSAMPASAADPSVDVTGPWTGTWAYQHQDQGAGPVVTAFEQNGRTLTGTITLYGTVGRDYTVVGFVDGNHITLSQPAVGTLTVDGNEINGTLDGWDNARINLRRQ